MKNLNVVNIHRRGLTSRDVRDFLGSDSVDVLVGCRRSFLSVCVRIAVARSVSYYTKHPPSTQFALGVICGWSDLFNLVPDTRDPAKRATLPLAQPGDSVQHQKLLAHEEPRLRRPYGERYRNPAS